MAPVITGAQYVPVSLVMRPSLESSGSTSVSSSMRPLIVLSSSLGLKGLSAISLRTISFFGSLLLPLQPRARTARADAYNVIL